VSTAMAQPGVYNQGKSWQSDAKQAVFTANIVCIPEFTSSLVDGDLGDFFVGGVYTLTGANPANFYLSGPTEGDYTVNYSLQNTNPASFSFNGTMTIAAMAVDVANWNTAGLGKIQDDGNNGVYLNGAWSVAGTTTGQTTIGCDHDN
jgi:hypothetical protein